MDGTLYDLDFPRWAEEQAARLRARGLAEAEAGARPNAPIDWANIAEELEGLSRRERRAVVSLLAIVLEHALKLQHGTEPAPRRQWTISLRTARRQALRRLRESPSLAAQIEALAAEAYEDARLTAALGLGLPEEDLPPDCPYATEALLEEAWLPVSRWGLDRD
jgi:hypothetical protein